MTIYAHFSQLAFMELYFSGQSVIRSIAFN